MGSLYDRIGTSREEGMGEDTYNGWKNYPTWAVNLWLSNDEGLYNEARERAQCCADDLEVPSYFNAEQALRFSVADMLKEWVTDDLAPDLGASFAADLLGYALDCVDWHEIADAWIEQVSETA
jgi:hypothetical protein